MPEYSSLQKDYAKYRMERAREDLDAAHLLFDAGNYRIANNRAYYAIFHAMRAVLVVMLQTTMICLLPVRMIQKSR